MNKVLLLSILFLFTFKLPVQTPKKVALIIQNTLFKDGDSKKVKAITDPFWQSLDAQESNAAEVKSLLMRQGFPKEEIVVAQNVTAEKFRNTVESFIKDYVTTGAICVVYISSIGTRIKDGSGDEQDLPNPKEDEVIICKDSPGQKKIETERKTIGKGSRSMDCHPKAIIDDEVGVWNDEIRSKIGQSGHYLLLADFCNSDGTGRGETGEIITDLQTTSQSFNNKADDLSVFLLIAASTKEIYVNPTLVNAQDKTTRTGYYVKALIDSFNRLNPDKRSYGDLFNLFKAFLMKSDAYTNKKERKSGGNLSKDRGIPTLLEGHVGVDAKEPLWGGRLK